MSPLLAPGSHMPRESNGGLETGRYTLRSLLKGRPIQVRLMPLSCNYSKWK